MKKMAMLLFAIIGLILLPGGVYADPINVGNSIWLSDREGTTGGGEFGVATSAGGPDLFRTFCMEKNEYFTPGAEYIVGGISDRAYYGGSGGGPAGDPLDPNTAYLYTMFRMGTLSNYDYTPGTSEHVKDANSLQRAIWYFEQEIIYPDSDLQAIAWITEANNAGWTDIGNVRVINLVDPSVDPSSASYRRQDQLVLVPEPGTILLLGSGFVGLALLTRLRKRKV